MSFSIRPLALACLLAATALTARATDFDTRIAEARSHAQQSQFRSALDAALKARALNPADYRSYYYEAMAQIGLGRRDDALTAVRAAQQRAPASAKAALDKLEKIAQDTAPDATADAAPASTAVFVSCTHVRTGDDDRKEVESTVIWRLEPGNFQYWRTDAWSANQCVYANTNRLAAKHHDIVHRCDVDERRFQVDTSYEDNVGWRNTDRWSINRVTGKFAGRYTATNGTSTVGDTTVGTCRAVKDPSADVPRKF